MRSGNPDLSIIVISYNTARITTDCITSIYESLQGSNIECEVIVIDNNSSDSSPAELKRLEDHYSTMRVILNKENSGFGKANNQGVTLARSDTILLLNSDILVLNNAVEKLLHFYREHQDEFAFVGGKLLNQDLTPQASCGAFFSLPVVFAFLFLFGDRLGLTRTSPDVVCASDWISGACIMTSKTVYDELSGFDESIFMYMEEVDLLFRGQKKGYLTGYTPDAQFIHLGSASSDKTYPIINTFRGLQYLYTKHYPRYQLQLLSYMLQLKALISVVIGRLTGNTYLIKTYEQAYRISRMAGQKHP